MKCPIIDAHTRIICDENDFAGVREVAEWVRNDLRLVFGDRVSDSGEGTTILVGSLEKSDLLRVKREEGILSADGLRNEDGSIKREVYRVDLIKEGDADKIVIQGADKRGTMYGLLAVSESCGVSPLVNWSGAKPAARDKISFSESFFGISKEPSVKYRGIFINDEWPAFGNWAKKRFGGINAECYAEVFELMVRLRANYLWPAMWNSNFSLDGPGLESAELADKLGIVMSTSHHEPCMRSGEEYRMVRGPKSVYGDAWDFRENREGIIRFWEDGLKRNAPFENVITMGMRGERDTAIMAQASLEDNIALLRDIIKTQNDLIRKCVNSDLSKVARQFVLFTEVEKFYYGDENTPGLIDDPEMDGITVMFSDTNFGYTRTLPAKERRGRNGGHGLYYHVDMHGGPYAYEWIGSTYLPRIWDQLGTAYDYGIRDILVVNVGDLVSQELELSYIMKMAFDMENYGSARLNNAFCFVRDWVERIFGDYYSKEDRVSICEIISEYTLINERRKHEIMNDRVYHPAHYDESKDLYEKCVKIQKLCDELLERSPKEIRTAFYELIYYPAYGTANLHKTWIASAWNKYYANQNRNTANDLCAEIEAGLEADRKLIADFHALADGKYYGHALSEHFGFRNWNDSGCQFPMRTYVYPSRKSRMLVTKSDDSWFYDGREYTKREDTLYDFLRPDIDDITLEISCGSENAISYTVTTDKDWIGVASEGTDGCIRNFSNLIEGKTYGTDRIRVGVDRKLIPSDVVSSGTIIISDGDECFVTLTVRACGKEYYEGVCRAKSGKGISKGSILVHAGHAVAEGRDFAKMTATDSACYRVMEPYGRHGSGLKLYPNTIDLTNEDSGSLPYAEYLFFAEDAGEYDAEFIFAPSFPVNDESFQFFEISVNGEEPARINTIYDSSRPVFLSAQWTEDNRRNAKIVSARIHFKAGVNRLSYCQLSPNLILERIVLWDTKWPQKESYLGPKNSYVFE